MRYNLGVDDTLYAHPAYYDMLFGGRRSDLPFYLELAREVGGSVLELGAGTGRVALALARSGCDVTGVDRSAPLLDTLAARAAREPDEARARLHWHLRDVVSLDLGRRFDLVLCPFNGIAHFHGREMLDAFFETVTAHLAPGGTFAFDVLRPDPALLRGDVAWVPWLRDPERGEACRAEQMTAYDACTQVLTITTSVRSMEADRPPLELTLRLRVITPEEALRSLLRHGFHHVEQRLDLGDVIGYACRR